MSFISYDSILCYRLVRTPTLGQFAGDRTTHQRLIRGNDDVDHFAEGIGPEVIRYHQANRITSGKIIGVRWVLIGAGSAVTKLPEPAGGIFGNVVKHDSNLIRGKAEIVPQLQSVRNG